jgi:N-acyl-D-amino-acid deacylase
MQEGQGDIKYKVEWNTLGEYMNFLEKKGISPNIASFIGTDVARVYVLGEDNIAPSPAQLDSMKLLVRQAMEEGALGVTDALIYPPATFAKTDELIALSKEASKYGGTYSSHMRSEGNKLWEAVEELITISKEANIPAEIHHLESGRKR